MSRRPVSDPIVQHAIAQRARWKERRGNREIVLRLLAERGIWTLHELAEASELSREDCAFAIDELRVQVLVELTEDGRLLAARVGTAMGKGEQMSRSLNRVQLLGHLGQDAETKFTPTGVACTSFSLATNRRWKDQQSGEYKEATDWHRCVLWRSENVSQYLVKGKQIFVEGRMQTRSWEDKDKVTRYTTEVVVSDLVLLGGGGDQARPAGEAARPRQQTTGQEAPPDAHGITDDDVPF